MPVFKDQQQQAEIYREMDRLSAKYDIKGELLDVESLARVLGKSVRDLWNMKARNSMPAIPVQRIGGRDHFQLVHVAMYTLGQFNMNMGSDPAALARPERKDEGASEKEISSVIKSRKSRRQRDVMDDFIERKTLEILQTKNPKDWGSGSSSPKDV